MKRKQQLHYLRQLTAGEGFEDHFIHPFINFETVPRRDAKLLRHLGSLMSSSNGDSQELFFVISCVSLEEHDTYTIESDLSCVYVW